MENIKKPTSLSIAREAKELANITHEWAERVKKFIEEFDSNHDDYDIRTAMENIVDVFSECQKYEKRIAEYCNHFEEILPMDDCRSLSLRDLAQKVSELSEDDKLLISDDMDQLRRTLKFVELVYGLLDDCKSMTTKCKEIDKFRGTFL